MGYCPDWQRQNMKKTGSSGPTTTPSRKDMGSLFHSTPVAQNPSMTKPMRLADGDTEETYKQRGLEASKGENVGFFERLRMGSIDQSGSEAYNRFGAGRAYADNMDAEYEGMRSATRSRLAETSAPASTEADNTGVTVTPIPEPSVSTAVTTSAPARSTAPARRRATSSVSGPATRSTSTAPSSTSRPSAPDESAAESSRLSRMNASLAAANAARTSRAPVRTTAPAASPRGQDRILRDVTPGEVDPKTLLPKR